MNWDAISGVSEIVGAILIVTSLIYVARQLHQTTEMLKSESRQAMLANDQAAILKAMDHSDLFEAAAKPDRLSFRDQFRFSMMLVLDLRNREHEYFQHKAGVLDTEAWLSYREIIRLMFDNRRSRKWWNELGRAMFDPQFSQMVDEMISTASLDDTYSKFGSWE